MHCRSRPQPATRRCPPDSRHARARRLGPHQRAGLPRAASRGTRATRRARPARAATRRRSRRSAVLAVHPDAARPAPARRRFPHAPHALACRHRRRDDDLLAHRLRVPRVLGNVFSHRLRAGTWDRRRRPRPAQPAEAQRLRRRRGRHKACEGASPPPLCWHCVFVLLAVCSSCAAARVLELCCSSCGCCSAVRQALAFARRRDGCG